MLKKNIHISLNDKFMNAYINFIKENFSLMTHDFFLIYGVEYIEPIKHRNVYFFNQPKNRILFYLKTIYIYFFLYIKLLFANKIILHSLSNNYTIFFLFLNPWFLRKCNWIIWGGDLYSFEERNYLSIKNRIFYKIEDYVKGNLGYYSTVVEGDYKLAQKYYGAKGIYYKGFNYPSNLYKKIKLEDNKDEVLNIQIGNSAYKTNNHLEILNKLEKFKKNEIRLFCILSYGDKEWAKEVIKYGQEKFGEKFIPILDFMQFDEYMKFISKIDIAIFAHDRQQGVGNIVSLLSMRKTIYIKKDVTTYEMLKEKGIKILDFNELSNLEPLSIEVRKSNEEIIKREFSKEKLKENLARSF